MKAEIAGDLLQALVTSRARREVVELLVCSPDREFGIRELERLVSSDYRAVRAELRRLEAADLLTCRREGRSLRYRWNLRTPGAAGPSVLALEATGILALLREHLEQHRVRPAALLIGPGCPDGYRLLAGRRPPPLDPEPDRWPHLVLQTGPVEILPGDLMVPLTPMFVPIRAGRKAKPRPSEQSPRRRRRPELDPAVD